MKKILIYSLLLCVLLTGCAKKPPAEDESSSETAQKQDTAEVSPFPEMKQGKIDEPIVTEENSPGEYTAALLSKYINNGTYYILHRETTGETSVDTELAVSGNKAAVRTEAGTQILIDETWYMVMHDSQAVLTSPAAAAMKDGFTKIISVKSEEEAKEQFVASGTEAIEGAELVFEEYKDSQGNVSKYYFDSQTLRYVKIVNAGGAEIFSEIFTISKEVPEGIFDVPDGYIIRDLSKVE